MDYWGYPAHIARIGRYGPVPGVFVPRMLSMACPVGLFEQIDLSCSNGLQIRMITDLPIGPNERPACMIRMRDCF